MPAAHHHVQPRVWGLDQLSLLRPSSVEELAHDVANGATPLAGGTDLLIELQAGARDVNTALAWTGSIPELRTIRRSSGQLVVGAAVTLRTLVANDAARPDAVSDAAGLVGSEQIRQAATVAGNICTASPAADTVPALSVHDAHVHLLGADGTRSTRRLDDFLVGPRRTALPPATVVAEISWVVNAAGEGSAYRRFTERRSMDIAFAGLAVRLGLAPDRTVGWARIAMGAVGPTVIMANNAAERLLGTQIDLETLVACASAAAQESSPINDLRASAGYRRRLIASLVHDAVPIAYSRARGDDSSP